MPVSLPSFKVLYGGFWPSLNRLGSHGLEPPGVFDRPLTGDDVMREAEREIVHLSCLSHRADIVPLVRLTMTLPSYLASSSNLSGDTR